MVDKIDEKWIGWSRNAWGNVLMYASGAMLLLSAATPDTVATVMTPFVALLDALGWEVAPELQDRAMRAALAAGGIVGVIAKIRSRIAPDYTSKTLLPEVPKTVAAVIGETPEKE